MNNRPRQTATRPPRHQPVRLRSWALGLVFAVLSTVVGVLQSSSMVWPGSQTPCADVAVTVAVNTDQSTSIDLLDYRVIAGQSHGPPTVFGAQRIAHQTYYVLAGSTAVLVHNEGDEPDPYVPSLRKLSNKQAEKYVGDIHEFKMDVLGRKEPIARFDLFVDTNNGNIYLNTKNGAAVDAIQTGANRNGAWVEPRPTPPAVAGCE